MDNLLPVRSSRRSLPPPSDDDPSFVSDEGDSAIFELAETAVLLLATDGDDVRQSRRALEDDGAVICYASAAVALDKLSFLPRVGVIELGLPGAWSLFERVNAAAGAMQVIAILEPGEAEGPALAAGATLTLHRPFDAETLVLCVRRLRAHVESERKSRAISRSARRSVPAPMIESVLATIGHEINNPLSAALASVECLRESESARSLSEDERREAVADTTLALRRIQNVMNAVTALVKGAPPAIELVSLWESAERAIDALSPSHVRIGLAGDQQLCALANAPLLEQVIANLVANAIEASSGLLLPQVMVRIYRSGDEARISVRDNGPGVPEALRARIFEPFFTTKGEGGTGLGLVLARHAVGRMGGSLSLGAGGAVGNGAVFRVRLPTG